MNFKFLGLTLRTWREAVGVFIIIKLNRCNNYAFKAYLTIQIITFKYAEYGARKQ